MPSNSSDHFVLEMKNITKNFPGVCALSDVSISLKKGEVLGLLGENGAGKSTLIKILSGLYRLESGEIIIDGESFNFKSTKDSMAKGIRVIYQEILSFDPLTVIENIFSGELEIKKSGLVNWGKMVEEGKKLLSEFYLDIDPMEIMSNLSVAQKQIIEIIKAVHAKAKIIVMDEPTSSLSKAETEILYTVIRKLKNEGVSIIYITHRLEEIFIITDRISVLRDGKKVSDLLTSKTDNKELVDLIVGKAFSELYPKRDIEKKEIIFEVKNLAYFDILKNISFSLRKGEILAFYGLLGSGLHLLPKVLFGDIKSTAGSIFINGEQVDVKNPNIAKNKNIGFVPIDKRSDGLALRMSVKNNIVAANIDNTGKGVLFNKSLEKKQAEHWTERLGIKTPNVQTIVKSLSGGNQQKIVVAKWLECESKILIMTEPTIGIDVGSKAEIYNIVEDLCEEGAGILIFSSELQEIMSISDRLIVLKDGEMVEVFETKQATQEKIMHLVTN